MPSVYRIQRLSLMPSPTPMTSPTPLNVGLSHASLEPPRHPDVAVVVVARAGGETLEAAVRAIAAVGRAYGVEVLVLIPGPAGSLISSDGFAPTVKFIPVDESERESDWRGTALAETTADIVVYVDDTRAARIPWEESLPQRLGLVRPDSGESAGLHQALMRLGVLAPAQSGPSN